MRFTAIVTAVAQLAAVIAAPTSTEKRTSCTLTDFSNLAAVKSSCSTITIGTLSVPAGKTLDLTGLPTGTKVVFAGIVTFGYKEWVGPLVSVSGTQISVVGNPGHCLDGHGESWWDGKGGNGGKIKPKFFFARKMYDSTIKGIYIKNAPVHCFSINNSRNLVLDSVTVDNSHGDKNGGHNTDAFNVGSCSDITINNATVYNQDDCLAVNSGQNIVFSNGYCSGGHGVSIGSVGGRANNVVKGVTVTNTKIVDSENGVRIKTVYNATGSVSDITYSDITLQNITKYGIVIQQDYENGKPTGEPSAGVPITDVTIKNVKGSVKPKGSNIYILCASCSDFNWSGVSVSGGKTAKCVGQPNGVKC